jgi:hypothetical protein
VVLPFAFGYSTIIVCDRVNISRPLSICVVLGIVLYLLNWCVFRSAISLKDGVNGCAEDSIVLIVVFCLFLNWNGKIISILLLAICAVAIYY